jgi:hypothetical protein
MTMPDTPHKNTLNHGWNGLICQGLVHLQGVRHITSLVIVVQANARFSTKSSFGANSTIPGSVDSYLTQG